MGTRRPCGSFGSTKSSFALPGWRLCLEARLLAEMSLGVLRPTGSSLCASELGFSRSLRRRHGLFSVGGVESNRLRQDQPRAACAAAVISSPKRGGGPCEAWWRGTLVITGPRQSVKLARKLRSELSLPEATLWRELRKRPGGFKFRRQHPAGAYVLDFYCASVRLAIEVDGFAHDNASVAHRDKWRSEWLRSQHIATTRIPAQLVLEDVNPVVERIVEICLERKGRVSGQRHVPLHQPAAGPPPPMGED